MKEFLSNLGHPRLRPLNALMVHRVVASGCLRSDYTQRNCRHFPVIISLLSDSVRNKTKHLVFEEMHCSSEYPSQVVRGWVACEKFGKHRSACPVYINTIFPQLIRLRIEYKIFTTNFVEKRWINGRLS